MSSELHLNSNAPVLVTGASGYIGGRLTETLLSGGYRVRCMVRDRTRLALPPHENMEIVEADVLQSETLPAALRGVSTAYYFIHSLKAGHGEFAALDVEAARNFGAAAKEAGVKRIIYLGGLGSAEEKLSDHLRSRQDTGHALRESGVSVTEFRAGSIIGSGSLAFEILRYLADRLPIMITPRWLETRTQPIAIADVLRYLTECLQLPGTADKIYEIGGADRLSYKNMMLTYAKVRGLRRFIIPVPLLTPYLSSLWISLVTPLPRTVARSLIEGLRNDITARDIDARRDFGFEPMGVEEAMKRALERSRYWIFASDNIPNLLERKVLQGGKREILHSRGFIIEKRIERVEASPDNLFEVISRIGGENGWPYADFLWRLRFLLDRLLSGSAHRQRHDPIELHEGDPVDFWQVERYNPGRRILLHNKDMKIPGEAWLCFAAKREESGKTKLTMTAFFEPKGALGVLYWYALYLVHRLIFGRTLGKIVALAQALDKKESSVTPRA